MCLGLQPVLCCLSADLPCFHVTDYPTKRGSTVFMPSRPRVKGEACRKGPWEACVRGSSSGSSSLVELHFSAKRKRSQHYRRRRKRKEKKKKRKKHTHTHSINANQPPELKIWNKLSINANKSPPPPPPHNNQTNSEWMQTNRPQKTEQWNNSAWMQKNQPQKWNKQTNSAWTQTNCPKENNQRKMRKK